MKICLKCVNDETIWEINGENDVDVKFCSRKVSDHILGMWEMVASVLLLTVKIFRRPIASFMLVFFADHFSKPTKTIKNLYYSY